MAKKLLDDLLPASFRGVAFEVDAAGVTAGRRTQVHEYPQRDKPYVEDLGRATRRMSFDAFLVGGDYVSKANKLLAALEQEGAGTLVHPWFGTLKVNLVDPAQLSFDGGLGLAKVSLSFVEAGELLFPSGDVATQSTSQAKAAALELSAVEAFKKRFNVKGYQDFVAAAAGGRLGEVLGLVSTSQINSLLDLSDDLVNTTASAIALVQNPESLGYKIMGALGLSRVATSTAAWANVVKSLKRTLENYGLRDPDAPAVQTASNLQAYENTRAINALVRQGLLAQAVGVSSLVGGDSDSGGAAYDAMMEALSAITSAIDAETLLADGDVYAALIDARAAVWTDITTRARDSARLESFTPAETLPALVLAYDYYEDASRADELVARNRIARPSFVPPAPLKVLTR